MGDLQPAQEVDEALNSEPIITESLIHSFASLLRSTLDGFHFIFTGTLGGDLLQVQSKNVIVHKDPYYVCCTCVTSLPCTDKFTASPGHVAHSTAPNDCDDDISITIRVQFTWPYNL